MEWKYGWCVVWKEGKYTTESIAAANRKVTELVAKGFHNVRIHQCMFVERGEQK